MPGLTFKKNTEMQNSFLRTIEEGATVTEAAKMVGTSKSTAYLLMRKDPEFQRKVSEARVKFLRESTQEFELRAPEAIATLLEVMHNPKAPASARVSAASRVLDYGLQFGEASDYEARLKELSEDISAAERGF